MSTSHTNGTIIRGLIFRVSNDCENHQNPPPPPVKNSRYMVLRICENTRQLSEVDMRHTANMNFAGFGPFSHFRLFTVLSGC